MFFCGKFSLHSPLGWIFAIIWVKFHQVSFANLTGWCESWWATEQRIGFFPSKLSDWLSTVQLKKHWDVWEVQKGVSLNGGTPISHPKMVIFSKENPWLLGTTFFRKPPYTKLKAMLLFSLGLAPSKQLFVGKVMTVYGFYHAHGIHGTGIFTDILP